MNISEPTKTKTSRTFQSFRPSLNGIYHIAFKPKDDAKGFEELMKHGKFQCLEDGYLVNEMQLSMLKEANIEVEILRS